MPLSDEPGRCDQTTDAFSLSPTRAPPQQAHRRAHDQAFETDSESPPRHHKRLRRLSAGSDDHPMPPERRSATNPVGEIPPSDTTHPQTAVDESSHTEAGRASPATRPSPTAGTLSHHSWTPAVLSPDRSFVEEGEGMFTPQSVPTTTAMPLSRAPDPSSERGAGVDEDTAGTGDVPATISDSSFPGALPYSAAIFSQAPSTSDALKLPFSPDSRPCGWAGPTMSSRMLSPHPQSAIPSHSQPPRSVALTAQSSTVTPLRASLLTSRLKPHASPSLSGSAGSATSKPKQSSE